jgi:hypothetical protein
LFLLSRRVREGGGGRRRKEEGGGGRRRKEEGGGRREEGWRVEGGRGRLER